MGRSAGEEDSARHRAAAGPLSELPIGRTVPCERAQTFRKRRIDERAVCLRVRFCFVRLVVVGTSYMYACAVLHENRTKRGGAVKWEVLTDVWPRGETGL